MGLWQKLFGWLNPSAPTAAQAPHAADDVAAAGTLGAAAAQEPAFDPHAELVAPAPIAPDSDDPQDPPAVGSTQPDLFEVAAAHAATHVASHAADVPDLIDNPALREVLSIYAGMAWDRQMDFAEKVGERAWSADTSQGMIQFGDDLHFRMQVLGSYAFQSGTWQWIWAHTQADVAPAYTEVARQLLGFGNAQQLPLFTQARCALREEDLHAIGLIAAGADESAGYYLGNYGEGILLALIDPGNGLPAAAPKPERVLTVVPQLISQCALDHRSLLRHSLQAKGFSVQETATEITGVQGATRVNAVLDAEGRISALHGSLAPSA